ncbi:TPA: vitamin K epoxide reductase family protein [Burkholderia cenocepacia]|uniref:vitamin K epoxide reductase family protein n=1 Tax=Burkholderia cenocepacia TaxID=95486 RepID=UPI001B8E3C70|nr:vitamin K epoxide reductase family protein [Burkholderia cenocepacia]MBR8098273.1 vitamin K epoxide reductase family protein [Burkholderia cenocepacia]HEP6426291.1 vitamin K epoxide reductase family protein [Burkholderia cenocepacia]
MGSIVLDWPRVIAIAVAAISAAAMLYVGLYQGGIIEHLVCPVTGYGCRTVADAPFARPFGIPDGYIGAALYGLIVLLLIFLPQGRFTWMSLLGLAGFATLANGIGVKDMMDLGAFCFWCLLTTILSPVLLGAIWMSR